MRLTELLTGFCLTTPITTESLEAKPRTLVNSELRYLKQIAIFAVVHTMSGPLSFAAVTMLRMLANESTA